MNKIITSILLCIVSISVGYTQKISIDQKNQIKLLADKCIEEYKRTADLRNDNGEIDIRVKKSFLRLFETKAFVANDLNLNQINNNINVDQYANNISFEMNDLNGPMLSFSSEKEILVNDIYYDELDGNYEIPVRLKKTMYYGLNENLEIIEYKIGEVVSLEFTINVYLDTKIARIGGIKKDTNDELVMNYNVNPQPVYKEDRKKERKEKNRIEKEEKEKEKQKHKDEERLAKLKKEKEEQEKKRKKDEQDRIAKEMEAKKMEEERLAKLKEEELKQQKEQEKLKQEQESIAKEKEAKKIEEERLAKLKEAELKEKEQQKQEQQKQEQEKIAKEKEAKKKEEERLAKLKEAELKEKEQQEQEQQKQEQEKIAKEKEAKKKEEERLAKLKEAELKQKKEQEAKRLQDEKDKVAKLEEAKKNESERLAKLKEKEEQEKIAKSAEAAKQAELENLKKVNEEKEAKAKEELMAKQTKEKADRDAKLKAAQQKDTERLKKIEEEKKAQLAKEEKARDEKLAQLKKEEQQRKEAEKKGTKKENNTKTVVVPNEQSRRQNTHLYLGFGPKALIVLDNTTTINENVFDYKSNISIGGGLNILFSPQRKKHANVFLNIGLAFMPYSAELNGAEQFVFDNPGQDNFGVNVYKKYAMLNLSESLSANTLQIPLGVSFQILKSENTKLFIDLLAKPHIVIGSAAHNVSGAINYSADYKEFGPILSLGGTFNLENEIVVENGYGKNFPINVSSDISYQQPFALGAGLNLLTAISAKGYLGIYANFNYYLNTPGWTLKENSTELLSLFKDGNLIDEIDPNMPFNIEKSNNGITSFSDSFIESINMNAIEFGINYNIKIK